MSELISVIVPVYNVQDYIEQCVYSIANQTYQELEIILVDDGSMDGSPQLCDRLAGEDSRIRVIHKENGGSTSARNAGLAVAKGRYVGFVDSDDWIDKDMYGQMYKCAMENKADIVAFAKYRNDGTSQQKVVQYVPEGVYDKASNYDGLIENLIYTRDYQRKGISPNLYTKLFDRELLMRHQLKIDQNTKFAEDDLCVYSSIIDADRVYVSNEAYYHYRIREDSVCTTGDDRYMEKINLFYRQMMECFLNSVYSDRLMPQLRHYMVEFAIHGINKTWGLGFGEIIPYFVISDEVMDVIRNKDIVLYGAGNVGRSFHKFLEISRAANVVMWADKNPRLDNVCRPDDMGNIKYDFVLVAVQGRDLMCNIKDELVGMGVLPDLIIYGEPRTIIGTF